MTTTCSSGAADPDPSLAIRFYCAITGSALGTLASIEVYMGLGTNASEFELELRNRAGINESTLDFPNQGTKIFTFQLDNTTGLPMTGELGR